MRVHRKAGRVLALTAAVGLLVAACGGDDSGGSGDSGSGNGDGGDPKTFIFGASDDPKTLDAAYVSDGESFRVIFQVYETLVQLEPGTTEVVPGLAEEWEVSDDGLTYTFHLREGVSFHDGEPFDAEAVCFNFDRWYNFTGPAQSGDVTYYWQTVFGGFATKEVDSAPDTSRYQSCAATDEFTATLTLTEPSSALLAGLVLPAFSIASPKAIEEGGTDIVASGDSFTYSGGFGSEVVAGTGPFQFVSWDRGESLVLERNEDYWATRPRWTRSSSGRSPTRPPASRRCRPVRSTPTRASTPPTSAPSRATATRSSSARRSTSATSASTTSCRSSRTRRSARPSRTR